MTSSIKLLYEDKITKVLKEKFQYNNIHEIPKITKITINRGLGEASQNSKLLEVSLQELSTITGQKPIVTKAKKAIAGFKLREDLPVGIKVTLRKEKMYAFLERLIHLALPRIRDFRGISKKQFDGRGNFNIGFKEQLMFPEISYDEVDKILGINVSISTTAKTDEECFELLNGLGIPFVK